MNNVRTVKLFKEDLSVTGGVLYFSNQGVETVSRGIDYSGFFAASQGNTGTSVMERFASVSGAMNSSGVILRSQVMSTSGRIGMTGIFLQNKIESLSGALIETGSTLYGYIQSVSGLLPIDGVGETNTASNLGLGQGLFAQKSIFDLQFFNISGGTGVLLRKVNNDVIVDSTLSTGQFGASGNLTQTGANLQGQINTITINLTSTGVTLHNEIIGLSGISLTNSITGQFGSSGNLTQTGINLQNQINTISGLALSSSGNIYNTGINLYNIITSLSGKLNETGVFVYSQINTINSNLTSSGVILHEEIIGLSGVSLTSTITGQFGSSGNITNTGIILHNEIVGLSGVSLTSAITGQFGASGNLTQTGITLHNEIIGLSGVSLTSSVTGQFGASGNLTQTGINLQGQINTISGLSLAISGNLYSTGINLYNLTTSLSGKLNESGVFLFSQITTTNTNLLNTGVTLHNEIVSLSGVVNARITGINVTGSNTLGGLVSFTGLGSVQTILNGQTIIVSGAAGGAGSPGGNNRDFQYNNNSSFAGASQLVYNSLNNPEVRGSLTFSGLLTEPSIPASGSIQLYCQQDARATLQIRGFHGVESPLQFGLYSNSVSFYSPGNSLTTGATIGFTLASTGVMSHPTLTTGGLIQTVRRSRWQSVATKDNGAGIFTPTLCFRGNKSGQGGFFFASRFGLGANITSGRFFVGLSAFPTQLGTTLDATGAVNTIGMHYSSLAASTTNLRFMSRGGPRPADLLDVDLGANAPRFSGDLYELLMFAQPSGSGITVKIQNLTSGTTILNNVTYDTAAVLPSGQIFLSMQAGCGNRFTAAQVNIDVNSLYLETDY